jgi:peptide/nickel transport system substrate-binding protein
VIALPGDLQTADPTFGSDGNSDYIFHQVMEGLVDLNPAGTQVTPRLASSWTVSSDGLAYTFTLRSGAKFHDGTPFNAAAVKYNFDRWRNLPSSILALASRYPRVYGGFGAQSNITSVDAPNDTTVVFHLAQPRTNFLTTLTLSSFYISSPTALQAGDANNPDMKANKYANGSGPSMVGTGPFAFSAWVRADHITLKANDQYWGGKPYLDGITFKPITDDTAAVNALQAGDVDFAMQISPNDTSALKGNPKLQVINRGQACNTFTINMNLKYAPLNNKDIRLAVAYALNRQSYIDTFYAGQATLANNYAPEWMKYAIPLDVPGYDPAKAKQLIQGSGVQSPTLDFWYPGNVTRAYMPDPKGIFEAMSRDLRAVGFTVVAHTEGWTTGYLTDRTAGKFPMWLFGNFCGWPSIDYMYNFSWFGSAAANGVRLETGYGTPALQQAMTAGLSAPTDAAAAAAWTTVQDTIKADFPMVPILHALTPGAASADMMDLETSNLLFEDFDKVWLNR